MDLEGSVSELGVPFERRVVELCDGLSVDGVFPHFESIHHVELGPEAHDMSNYEQFKACKEDYQNHMFDDPSKLEGLTLGDMDRLDKPQGFAPARYTWHHNPETGEFELVLSDVHSGTGHSSGNALW